MKIRFYILTILLFTATLLHAQDARLTATVASTQVATGEQFEVMFSINTNGDHFAPPDFNGFRILAGPNISTSMSSVNGVTTMSNSYSYYIMAEKEGSYTIAPATIFVNGRRLTSNGLTIKVVKGRPVQQQRQQNMQAGGNAQAAAPAEADMAKNLFMRAVADKTDVYQGSQITVSYRLYTRVDLLDSQVDKIPDLNGFWSQDVKNSKEQQVRWHIETYKGQRYNVADIKQTILFPEHAGNLTIDPLGMTFLARVPVAPRNEIEAFFGGGSTEVKQKVKSAPVTIHVKPLPEAGKPESFTGAVGKFSIEASVDKSELKANEAINYRVKVTGSGNIKLFKDLSTNFPADFEKYDPKITDTITESINGVSGSRVYNYLLIPRHQGSFTIEPLKFTYFNPNTGKYVTLTTKAFPVKVNKGDNEANVTAFTADKQDIKVLDKDIRYIKTGDTELAEEGDGLFGSGLYYLLLTVGPIACAAAFVYRNKNRKLNSDVVKVKSRRAGKMAAKHLASAQKQLQANNTKAFYEDVFKGLYGYLSDKLNISYADLNKETIASNLKTRNLDDQLTRQLLDTLDLCEMARYAPVTHISQQEVFDKARGIINDIESKI
ncbi:BatD family protein [Mucilaginibacter gynuensis]|uniref:BatD family protein n=1 Tax=Mucilaginibacter gynuensis TaxID=1302236 RepID=A0ABP8FVL2_9SPHI